MIKKIIIPCLAAACILFTVTGCVPALVEKTANTENLPKSFNSSEDTTNTAAIQWKAYFTDPYLIALIDTALENNQELNISLQDIELDRNEIMARKGEYLPFVSLRAGSGLDKKARYTALGASEANTEIKPGREMPEPVPDFMLGAFASWEVDIWHKLRNARLSAVNRYFSTMEGRNFLRTNLVAEIANSYYELLALDNQLEIVQKNIGIRQNALEIARVQKQAARVTELAVRKFEAEVLSAQSLQYNIQQQIFEIENRINFLLGRYPQPVRRNSQAFNDLLPAAVQAGIPSQLLENRPDVKQAEWQLKAAKLDVEVAKANFYPSLDISAGVGMQAFNPAFLIKAPESILYSLVGDLTEPIINRNAIKAAYFNANARQIQAVYNYERTILNAYLEVINQLSNISNLDKSYDLKERQVAALTQSIDISNVLFKSARADYLEVLTTQRDALESKFELVEIKMQQMSAWVNIYRSLGGGWK
jgi:NodT family efflux transporter outer membrane factor (OMF) lipoprotein